MSRTWRVLAIDGGGIRGIIPATVLSYIEKQTAKPISQLFDLIAGTSTGGILALGLTKPSPTAPGLPHYSARDLIGLYEQEGPNVFPQSASLCRLARQVIRPKYSASGIERTLARYFQEARLSESLTDVLVTAYDIERRAPFFFKRTKARSKQAEPVLDFFMKDVARSASAAPTYFPPAQITTVVPAAYHALIDGAVFAGSPAMCAFAEARSTLTWDDQTILLVSLGTGKCESRIGYEKARNWGALRWALPLLQISLGGSEATVDHQLRQLLSSANYFRFQCQLEFADDALDNASQANIRHLKLEGEQLVKASQAELDHLCTRLLGPDEPPRNKK